MIWPVAAAGAVFLTPVIAPAQSTPASPATSVQPNAATTRALTEAERERAAATAREMREFKERVSLQSQAPGETNKPRIVTGYRSLEQNIKVDRSASVYTAPRDNSVSSAPVPVKPEKKKKKLLGGLFGNKDKDRDKTRNQAPSSDFESDVVKVEPLGEAPKPPVAISEGSRASADRIPPPPGFSEPAPVVREVAAPPMPPEAAAAVPDSLPTTPPGEPIAIVKPASSDPVAAPAPQVAPQEDKGLIGGLFSAITPGTKNEETQAATMAGAGTSENRKKGLFGRIFGRDDDQTARAAATAPAAAPRAIPPPEIPPPAIPPAPVPVPVPEPTMATVPPPPAPILAQPGSVGDPTPSGRTPISAPSAGFQNPGTGAQIPPPSGSVPAPRAVVEPSGDGRSSLVISPSGGARTSGPPSAVSAYTGTAPVAAVPRATAPVIATPASPAPATAPAAAIATPSSAAHFLVVKDQAGTPLQSVSGDAIQALPSGEVVQFRKQVGTYAFVRLSNGTEGYVLASSLREANFSEASSFYAAGGSRAE